MSLYKLVGTDEEVVIKVPKKIEDQDSVAFLDLIYQTQLMQFLKDNRTDGEKVFFPNVHEEVFVVNKNTHTILNYITVVEYAQTSLINMLDGPTAGAYKSDLLDEEGYRSQEIFTQEKYAYLYYKGLMLLEFLYDNGMVHQHINANSLRISEDYTFTLSDFPLSVVTAGFASMDKQEQEDVKVQVRGFNKQTVSKELGDQLNQLITKQQTGKDLEEEKKEEADHARDLNDFYVSELIREDWRDMVTTFYFPRLSKMITDPSLRQFIDNTNKELLEPGQEAAQIKNIALKAHRFVLGNIWILEDLIDTLKAEQMFDAVISIGLEIFELGKRMENTRL